MTRDDSRPLILVLDGPPQAPGPLGAALADAGLPAAVALDLDDLLHRLHRERCVAVVLGGASGAFDPLAAAERIERSLRPSQMLPVIVADPGPADRRADLLDAGVFSLLAEGWTPAEAAAAVRLAIEAKSDHDQLVEAHALLAQHREKARQGVQPLLAPQPPALPGWRFAARAAGPASPGADFCDLHASASGRLLVAFGEISGDEPHSFLGIATIRAVLRDGADRGEAAAAITAAANRRMADLGEAPGICSLYLALLDPATGDGEHLAAGRAEALSCAGGGFGPLPLDAPGSCPLGVEEEWTGVAEPLSIAPGSKLALASNGVAAALGPTGFMELLTTLDDAPAGQAADFVMARIAARGDIADDASILLVERLPSA